MSTVATAFIFDDVTLSLIPPDAQAIGVYTDGLFADVTAARAMFPKAMLLPITVFGQAAVRWGDCEKGDMTPRQVAQWAAREIQNGRRPGPYCSVSDVMTVVTELGALGVHREQVDFWSAHYTGVPHICGPQCGFGMDFIVGGTQYTDRALGRSLDESLFFASVLGITPPPPPNVAGPLAIFPTVVPGLGNERKLVEQTNGALKHPLVYRNYLKGKLRPRLKQHRDRLWRVSKYEPASFTRLRAKADWVSDHRGERWQQLDHLMNQISGLK